MLDEFDGVLEKDGGAGLSLRLQSKGWGVVGEAGIRRRGLGWFTAKGLAIAVRCEIGAKMEE